MVAHQGRWGELLPVIFDETMAYTTEGNLNGATLVFIHGWPDNASLWRHQVAALGGEYRCVLLTLPNFGEEEEHAGGYNFPLLVELLARTVASLRRDDERVVLVTHDWGAYIGYLYEQLYPDQILKMVALDVGGHVQPTTAKEVVFIVGYQWILIACWLVGGVIAAMGDWLTRKFAHALRVPARQAASVRSRFNYPYFFFWRGMLVPWARKTLLAYYRPRCPVLFMYGAKKPVMFHSERWLNIVEKSGGRIDCIEEAGHWLMESHPERVNEAIARWLTD